jgi:hypothetical protein
MLKLTTVLVRGRTRVGYCCNADGTRRISINRISHSHYYHHLLIKPTSTLFNTSSTSGFLLTTTRSYSNDSHNNSHNNNNNNNNNNKPILQIQTKDNNNNNNKIATMSSEALDKECCNTIRAVAADMVQSANSGHPGAPMGCAPMAHVLWSEVMNYSPTNPDWINRDRFVLSNGHACALQYTMLHLTGYENSTLEDLKDFRQLGSTTPGHPENFVTKGMV